MSDAPEDELVEIVGLAIDAAQKAPWEQYPYGLFDYTNYGGIRPYVVRDFRDRSNNWGASVFASTDHDEAEREYQRLTRCHVALAAIASYQKAIEGEGGGDGETLNRYRYAVEWTAADSWDHCSECRGRLEWARALDPKRLTNDEIAAVGKQYVGAENVQAPAIEGEGGDAEIAAQLRKLLAAYPLGTMDWPLDVMTAAAAALERREGKKAPKLPRLAIESLRNLNRQMDPDGVMVGVSREALHEVLVWIAVYEKEHSCPTSK